MNVNNLFAQGKSKEALPLYQESVRIFKSVLGENHPNAQIVQKGLDACRNALEGGLVKKGDLGFGKGENLRY